MSSLLLDTDIIIDHLRKYPPAKSYLQKIFSEGGKLTTSVITEAEILAGKLLVEAHRKFLVTQLLNHFIKIPVSSEIAQLAGKLKRCHDVRLMDALIAATALKHDLKLISRNIKHYRDIPELQTEQPYE